MTGQFVKSVKLLVRMVFLKIYLFKNPFQTKFRYYNEPLNRYPAEPYVPPWNSVSQLELRKEPSPESKGLAKLYPNVKGCGYPPDLDCDAFFEEFGNAAEAEGGGSDRRFDCWVSTLDGEIAMTELNLARIKMDVLYREVQPDLVHE